MSQQLVEEFLLCNAAKNGAIHAVNRLAELAESGAHDSDQFARIFPVLSSCLESQTVPPRHAIDWSIHDIHLSNFQLACFRGMSITLSAVHGCGTYGLETQVVMNQWPTIQRWVILLANDMTDALACHGPDFHTGQPSLDIYWRRMWTFVHAFHQALRGEDQVQDLWMESRTEYVQTLLRLWIAHSQHFDPDTSLLTSLDTRLFIASTSAIGMMFTVGWESPYDDILTDYPGFAYLLVKPLTLANRMPAPRFIFLDMTLSALAASTVLFDALTLRERDHFISVIMHSVRHLLLRVTMDQWRRETIILPVNLAGKALVALFKGHEEHQLAFATGMMRAGLFPVLHRLTLLVPCPCNDELCPWAAVVGQHYDLEQSPWTHLARLIRALGINQGGGVAYFEQLRKGIRWVDWDRERLQRICAEQQTEPLETRQWPEWSLLLRFVRHVLQARNQFETSPRRLCCGPKCPSAFMLPKQYKLCSGCNVPVYCSRACQKKHWVDSHHQVCQLANDICHYPLSPSSIDIAFKEWRVHQIKLSKEKQAADLKPVIAPNT